ncbi:SDR family NAD(P)-dependent oxidoreductase [Lactococcus nasutitermitis]|uniref:SDR family NAD(P)-dependent oxidoreductase n=1 Tax=Lactococcus nasutitermitis TaxID=1652957 RepID=A0ABV9JAV6_9LACT|nr:SDR family NAD(P)-dependent oxidoreductase [Lactococcus nasutitermitis]
MTRTIVITGATGDIAQEIVKKLSDDRLILLSRNLTELSKIYGNLSNVKLLENGSVIDENVDILINNAGFGLLTELSKMSEAQIDAQFQVNLMVPIELTRQLKPRVQLVNIVSIAAKLPSAKATIYAASKAGLLAFSDALRMELPELIVTTVNTGPVRTKFHVAQPDYLEKVGKTVLTAEKVADRIVKNLGEKKREINLPWQLALVAKIRAVFPAAVDFLSVKFFNFK